MGGRTETLVQLQAPFLQQQLKRSGLEKDLIYLGLWSPYRVVQNMVICSGLIIFAPNPPLSLTASHLTFLF